MKTKYTKAYYEFPSQLFKAHDSETPSQYAREAYDRTNCGVWTSFVLRDGTTIPSPNLSKHQDTIAWASRHLVGVQHGTIVEGSDAEFKADQLIFPFSDKQLAEAWDYLEELASQEWELANG